METTENTIISKLEVIARQQGYLTIDQINESLPDDGYSADMLDGIIHHFADHDIEIVDQDPKSGTQLEPPVIETVRVVIPKKADVKTNLSESLVVPKSTVQKASHGSSSQKGKKDFKTAKPIDQVDPLSLERYFHDISTFQPLTLETELEYGRQIHEGIEELKSLILPTSFAIHQLIKILFKIERHHDSEDRFIFIPADVEGRQYRQEFKESLNSLRKGWLDLYKKYKKSKQDQRAGFNRYKKQIQIFLKENTLVLMAIPFKPSFILHLSRMLIAIGDQIDSISLPYHPIKMRASKEDKLLLRQINLRYKVNPQSLSGWAKKAKTIEERINRAKNMLVNANLKLVVHMAKSHITPEISLYDLIQEGNMALIWAVERYDYTRGYRFSTYASWWIRQFVQLFVIENSKSVRVPYYVNSQINKIIKISREMKTALGRSPTDEELSKRLNWSTRKIQMIRQMIDSPLSLDQPVGSSEELSLIDYVASKDSEDPVESIDLKLLSDILKKSIRELPEVEQKVVSLRFGFYDGYRYSFSEIAKILSCSKRQAHYVYLKGLKHLRQSKSGKRLRSFLRDR